MEFPHGILLVDFIRFSASEQNKICRAPLWLAKLVHFEWKPYLRVVLVSSAVQGCTCMTGTVP